MDEVIHYIPVESLEEINNLLKAVANVVAREVNAKPTENEEGIMVEEAYGGTDQAIEKRTLPIRLIEKRSSTKPNDKRNLETNTKLGKEN